MSSTRIGEVGEARPVLPWGKMTGEGPGRVLYPLAHHTADVCAVLEAMLDAGGADRLGRVAGRSLTGDEIETLCALAGLHDLGKVSLGFQLRRYEGEALKGTLRTAGLDGAPRPWLGHTDVAWAALTDERWQGERAEAFLDALGDGWLATLDPTSAYLRAAVSHHGRPVERIRANVTIEALDRLWSPCEGYAPLDALAALVNAVQSWYPAAAGPLPDVPEVVHAYAGLISLADWVASDTHPAFFPYDAHEAAGFASGDRIGFARGRARAVVSRMGLDARPAQGDLRVRKVSFGEVFRGPRGPFAPTDLQAMMSDLDLGPTVAVEAETGSGKTEAAIWRYKTLFEVGLVDGLYMALPTRVAATQIEARLRGAIEHAFPDPEIRPSVVLAVPGYLRADGEDGHRPTDAEQEADARLTRFDVLWPDGDQALAPRRWAAEGAKRSLAAPVAVGTVDQALLAALKTDHAHLRGACLTRSLLVIDEVHASDAYMTRHMQTLLRRQERAGGHSLLLSATLGSDARRRLVPGAPPEAYAPDAPYPSTTDRVGLRPVRAGERSKMVAPDLLALMDDPSAIAALASDAALAGARVLIIRNTVSGVLAVQEALEATASEGLLFAAHGVITPHHSRYAACDRRLLDEAVERRFGKASASGGLVLCASQTCEVSLDIDADLMITDLCPGDVLLQRAGRLHRHERNRPRSFEVPRLIVLTPPDDLSAYLRFGRHGLGSVYEDLTGIEATHRWLAGRDAFAIPADNRALVEAATRDEALEALARELGPGWQDHRRKVIGGASAQRGGADAVRLDWTDHYETLRWTEDDEVALTRLGARDRLVRFIAPIRTPFGENAASLSVPDHLAEGVEEVAELAEAVQVADGVVRFEFGGISFVYDRLGLQRC